MGSNDWESRTKAQSATQAHDELPDAAVLAAPTAKSARALLAAAGLGTDDLPPSLEDFLAIGDPGDPQGIVGLELYGESALLRSLVVAEAARGRGYGRRLVSAAESHARARAVQSLYLLTDTAEAFFSALGYQPADRTIAPPAIRNTRQFAELCPASAAFMRKSL